MTTLTNLKTAAAAQVKAPYRERFANYRLVRVTSEVHDPAAGLAFARGEYAIAIDRDLEPTRVRCEKFITVWSKRAKADTSVRASNVEWL